MSNKPIIIIRHFTAKDADAFVELCQLHAIYEKEAYNADGKAALAKKRFLAENPPAYCLIVELDEVIIGYCTYMKQFCSWDLDYYLFLDCLFLTEKARGKGIGQRIMQQLINTAKEWQCFAVQWQTPSFNEGAIRFYKRLGGSSVSKERFLLMVE